MLFVRFYYTPTVLKTVQKTEFAGLPKAPERGHSSETPSAFSCGCKAVTCASEGGVRAGGAGGCSAAERIRLGPSPPPSAAARPTHTRAPSDPARVWGWETQTRTALGTKPIYTTTGRPLDITQSSNAYV